ncbi:MAG: DUF1841 family protein [Myxococcota bacterium]|nr:DUF1841 family protein [Myxococcota bacterium]
MSENEQRLVIEIPRVAPAVLSSVWKKMRSGEQLHDQEIYIGRSMADHPDWFPIFETMDVLKGDDTLPDGTNPFLHLSFHTLLGSQVFNGKPVAAQSFYQQRNRRGDSGHAIIHMMMVVFQTELHALTTHGHGASAPQFNWASYGKRLRKLARLKTKDVWQKLGYSRVPELADFHRGSPEQ